MLYNMQDLKAAGISADMTEIGENWVPAEGDFLAVLNQF